MADLLGRHRENLEHERDALQASLASLETVPVDARSGADHRRALDLCAHLVASRERWLGRIRGEEDRPADWFPVDRSAADTAKRAEAVYAAWFAFLEELAEADLDRAFSYTSWSGRRYENSVEDVLVQLYGHSWYHRGQIAALVRRSGGQPASSEYIVRRRRPVP